jgi:hypothetical protein
MNPTPVTLQLCFNFFRPHDQTTTERISRPEKYSTIEIENTRRTDSEVQQGTKPFSVRSTAAPSSEAAPTPPFSFHTRSKKKHGSSEPKLATDWKKDERRQFSSQSSSNRLHFTLRPASESRLLFSSLSLHIEPKHFLTHMASQQL